MQPTIAQALASAQLDAVDARALLRHACGSAVDVPALLDGGHAHELGIGRAEFCEHGEVTDGDAAGLVSAIRDRRLLA